MKKLLSLLGASSLIVSTAATVVACTGPKVTIEKANNSLANMQASSATVMKELILSDQFNLSFTDVSSKLGDLKAKDVISDFDDTDFNLNENSDLSNLTSQYFGNFNLQDINKSDNVNLNGTIGSTNQLWQKLGLNLGDLQDIISAILGGVLPTVNGFGLMQLIESLLPQLNNTLKNLGQNNKTIIQAVSIALKGIFTSETMVNKFSTMIDSFDIGVNYSELQVKDITSAAMISLSNALGLIFDTNYQVNTFSDLYDYGENNQPKLTATVQEQWGNSALVKQKLSDSGKNLGSVLGQMLLSNQTIQQVGVMSNDLENNIDRYITIAANIVQFLQFIQLQFSLFDDTKDYTPIDSQHLFVSDQTNKEYLHSVLDSKTIKEVTNTNSENVEGFLNLKYLFSVFKNAFGNLNDPEDKNGYSLQKFLTILLMGSQEVDIDNFHDDMTSPIARYLAGMLDSIALSFITTKVSNLPSIVEDLLSSKLPDILDKTLLHRFLTTFIERLLNGEKLDEPITNLVDDLFVVLEDILNLLDINIDESILNILNQIIDNKVLVQAGVNLIVNNIPLLSAKNSFQELYGGDPLNIEPFLNGKLFQTIVSGIPKEFAPTFDKVVAALNNFVKLKNNFLPNQQPLNLKNLLNTPLGKINSNGVVPHGFGSYYLNKSIVENINDFADQFKITGTEKLTDLESFNFKLSGLRRLFDLITNYTYQDVPNGYYGQNLISIILENLDQASAILGLKEDQSIGQGSLLDLIFNEFFHVDANTPIDKDSLYFLSSMIATIFKNLNDPGVDFSENYKTLFLDDNNFNFDFKNPSVNKKALLGQEIVVNYHNFKTNLDYTYSFDYTRGKVSDVFTINSLKKEQLK